jgi:hypothetical protein
MNAEATDEIAYQIRRARRPRLVVRARLVRRVLRAA